MTPNRQILEEAAQWFVDCRSGEMDPAARRNLDQWLRRSPEHLDAYLKLAAIWDEGSRLQGSDSAALISRGRLANIVTPLRTRWDESPLRAGPADGGPLRYRRWAVGAAATALVVVGGLISIFYGTTDYGTGIGEQRTVILSDGSTIELNSRSQIKVRYSRKLRAVQLVKGQALFEVAKNRDRPFVVTSNTTQVRAVGTQFDVNRQDAATVVSVVEGQVAVCAHSGALAAADGCHPPAPTDDSDTPPLEPHADTSAILLSTGQQLTVTSLEVQMNEHASLLQATAWIQHRLVFDSASLAEVARDFNRYSERQIVVEAGIPDDLRISGVFSTNDAASLLAFIRERPDIQIIETRAEIRIRRNISPQP